MVSVFERKRILKKMSEWSLSSKFSHLLANLIVVISVLSGRGGATNSHSGNRAFRSLVKQYQSNYLKVKKCDKPKVADTIVNIIHQKGGRFLKRHKSKGVFWVELSKDKAREKTCQALRERAPEIRRRRSVLDEDISSRHKDRDSSPSTVSVFNQSESGESDKLCNGVRTQILRTTLKHEKEEAISITEAPMIIRPFMALLCVELSEKQLKIPIDHLERQERDIYLRDFLPPVPSVQKKT